MGQCTCEAVDCYERQFLDDNRHFEGCPARSTEPFYRPTAPIIPVAPQQEQGEIKGLTVIITCAVLLVALCTMIVYQNRVIRLQEDLIVQMVSTNPACTEPITK